MNRLSRFVLVLLLSMSSGMALAQVTVQPVKPSTIHLYRGEVQILPISSVKRVAVGNGKLLSVTHLRNQLILIGTGVGSTNMLVWGKKKGQVSAYNIDISEQNTRQVAVNLRRSLHSIEGIKVQARGGRVILTGDVTPGDEKRVSSVLKNTRGVVNLTHAVNVNMKRMVYLDVQVVDFKKSVLRNLGIKWQNNIAGPALGVIGQSVSNPYFRLGDLTQGGNLANAFQGPKGPLQGIATGLPFSKYVGITSSLSSIINMAVQNGDAYILANPQLATRSGGDASFLAGGQIPIPVSSALGQTSVQYKNYGVKLNIKPYADRFGNILANVDTEVSQIDPSVNIGGYPGFLTRKTSSVVNVHSGQTIVMSGMVQAIGAKTYDKFPWLGNIPLLGVLFRNKNFQANRSELVIFVTPVVFNPGSPVNREVIRRGTQLVKQFNNSEGRGVYMPGFGVGPTAHLPPPSKDGDKTSVPLSAKHQPAVSATGSQTNTSIAHVIAPASQATTDKPTAVSVKAAVTPATGSPANTSVVHTMAPAGHATTDKPMAAPASITAGMMSQNAALATQSTVGPDPSLVSKSVPISPPTKAVTIDARVPVATPVEVHALKSQAKTKPVLATSADVTTKTSTSNSAKGKVSAGKPASGSPAAGSAKKVLAMPVSGSASSGAIEAMLDRSLDTNLPRVPVWLAGVSSAVPNMEGVLMTTYRNDWPKRSAVSVGGQ